MIVSYKLKEHPESIHTIMGVLYITLDSTFVWIYQIGGHGGPKPIRIKLARISYLKAGKMVFIPEEDKS